MIKNAFKNFSALAAGCLAAFLLLEIFLRLFNPLGFRIKGDKIILFPYKRYVIENTRFNKMERKITRTNNSLGFRGDEPPENLTEALSIIAVGGSTTEGFYLSDGKSWPEQFSRELSRSFSKVWANNAGMDGHSTFGHKILLSDYIVRIKPKLVMFLLGLNDMGMGSSNRYDRLLTENNDRSTASRLLLFAASKSEVFSALQNLYLHFKAIKAGLNHGELNLKAMPPAALSAARRSEIVAKHASYTAAFAARLEELVFLSRAAGIEPVLITQPLLCGKGADPETGTDLGTLPTGDDFVNCGARWEALELYNTATRVTAARLGVTMVDLAKKLPKDSRYFYDLYHFTAEGAGKAAKIVYSDLCPGLAKKYASGFNGKCFAD